MKSAALKLLFIFIFNTLVGASSIQYLNKQKGAVNDRASILTSETQSKLSLYSSDIFKKTGVAVVFLSIESNDDASPHVLAKEIYETLGIGKKSGNKGILLLVTLRERNFVIHNGDGIQDILSESQLSDIRRNAMSQFLLRDKWDDGISLVYSQLAQELANVKKLEPFTFLAYSEKYAIKKRISLQTNPLALFLFLLILIISLLAIPVIWIKMISPANTSNIVVLPNSSFGGNLGSNGFGTKKKWMVSRER